MLKRLCAAGLLLLGWMMLSVTAQAGVGPKSSIPRLSVVEETRIHIFKDHRSTLSFRGAYLIQTEEGKVPKMRLLTFDKSESRVKHFKAWTVNGKETTEVPGSMIQWTAVSEESGFSNAINVEVAFPKMNVGSVLAWEYELEETQAPVLGFYSTLYRLDSEYHSAKGFLFEVSSDVPLTAWEHDPAQLFNVESTSRKFSVRLKKDVPHNLVNETYGVLSPKSYPTLMVSTSNSWGKIGQNVRQQYESRLREPLPPSLQKTLAKVKKQKGFFAQVRELNRQLSQQIRYMGDWRGRHSGQLPRSLKAITESQFGDCKDYSLLAARLLRELGYEAHFASVFADRIPAPDFYYKNPNNYFNHQIVHVKIGKTEYWVDPTAQDDGSMVDDALAGRQALVWTKKPQMRRIPAYQEIDNGFNYRLTLTPAETSHFAADFSLESWGLESKFAREENQGDKPLQRWMMIFFPDVKAQHQQFKTQASPSARPWAYRAQGLGRFENLFDRTPLGEGLRLGYSGFLRALLDVDGTWLSDFDFGFPSTRSYEVEFKGRHFLTSGDESCRIQSPWLNIQLSLRNEASSAFLSYRESFRSAEIPNAKLKSAEFQELQSQIKNCLASRVLILQDPAPSSPQRGLASTGMSVQLKRVAPVPAGMAKYHPKALSPMKNPVPKREVADFDRRPPTLSKTVATAPAAKPLAKSAAKAVKKKSAEKKKSVAKSLAKTPAKKKASPAKTAAKPAKPKKAPASEAVKKTDQPRSKSQKK